ncbi:hypothetical protein [Actinacidiphila acidipaludis]|uniref:Uncharacterized protein n=1 Tax=Actinacidiphila acidipaludis TaxID=2873382 RepID=A0ABS7QA36_9ACTN|nr:hypothetical protein [Streptomyces acidipaludis]MBY8880016.1 hypothetical protein [Streptomyces acidipaludis]
MTSVAAPAAAPRFGTARAVADVVLFEGYVLYPYRASAAKNRLRWQFGVLVPPAWGDRNGEHSAMRTEVLMEPRGDSPLHAEVRFLRAQRRTVERALPGGGFEPADALDLPDRVLVPWDEGVVETAEVTVNVARLLGGAGEDGEVGPGEDADGPAGREFVLPFSCAAGEDTEEVRDAAGTVVGRLVRRRERVEGELRLSAAELPGPYRVVRLTAVVENTGGWRPPDGGPADREAALPHALVSAHLMLALGSGAFLSMTDPPEWARPAVAECRNEQTWPVLAGPDRGDDVVLSLPIVLEDHPHIAPESPGALYDATEIDEILALRTAALTDQEKREARGTDERAGAVIDLADSMPPEVLERLHGAVRSLREVTGPPVLSTPGEDTGLPQLLRPDTPWWDPAADRSVDPERDRVLVDGVSVGAGSRVRLRPGKRRTDAQDIFVHGRTALVEAVLHDVDGGVHVAVTVDGDPGAELRRLQGRFLYYQPDELTPVEDGA